MPSISNPNGNCRPTAEEASHQLLDAQSTEEDAQKHKQQMEIQLREISTRLEVARAAHLQAKLESARLRYHLRQWGYLLPKEMSKTQFPSLVEITGGKSDG